MALAEYFSLIKVAHVGLAMLSGAVFAGRGVGVLLGATAPMAPLVRRWSQAIDTALLAAALLLLAIMHLNPLAVPWLQVKLALLVAYIVFGMLALGRARTQAGRALAFAAALLCFTMMVSIAHTRNPLGLLSVFIG